MPDSRPISILRWTTRLVCLAALAVVGWALSTEWGGISHGNPVYAILLSLTVAGGVGGSVLSWRRPRRDPGGVWHLIGAVVGLLLAVGWIILMGYFRPLSAESTAVAAMESDTKVTVTESSERIVLAPSEATASSVGVFFQPGAKVDARAYVPALRELAADGHTVVIVKQPLGIAFFSIGALDGVKADYPELTSWVIGGHSLGGTVAAMEAVDADTGPAPVTGLFFWASYPADSIRDTFDGSVASISGSKDGLATPAKIKASKSDLPKDTDYTVVKGACHAQFGDYGPQPGDGTPTITNEEAQADITSATRSFVRSLEPKTEG